MGRTAEGEAEYQARRLNLSGEFFDELQCPSGFSLSSALLAFALFQVGPWARAGGLCAAAIALGSGFANQPSIEIPQGTA